MYIITNESFEYTPLLCSEVSYLRWPTPTVFFEPYMVTNIHNYL